MSEPEPLVPPGTPVVYWGHAAENRYYGHTMTVLWANQCNCAHQTYCLETTDDPPRRLEKVLRSSFRTEEDNG